MAHDLSAMGITGIQSVADLLADFGRGGDGYFAHTTEGETVVPLPVLDENPRLKQALFTQMREMGLEPERYIVGNELNSINPVTGQPEFGLKSFWRGAKNIIKTVAPIVLPVVFARSPLGPILGSAFGAGVGSAIAGRSTKDSFKAAAIAGGIATALRGAYAPEGVDPLDQIKADIRSPLRRIGQTLGGSKLGLIPEARSDYWVSPWTRSSFLTPESPTTVPEVSNAGIDYQPGYAPGTGTDYLQVGEAPTPKVDYSYTPDLRYGTGSTNLIGGQVPTLSPAAVDPRELDKRGFFKSIYDRDFKQAFFPERLTGREMYTAEDWAALSPTDKLAAQELADLQNPGLLRSYGPLYGAGAALLAATGGFKPGKQPDPVDYYGGVTGTDLLAQAPGKFSVGVPRVFDRASLGDISTLTAYPYTAQAGGPINYPPRVGPIYGPGTGTSDDVPAMLSDGEYVMTADAVRGAGNGNRQQGMRNMYDMMRQFEGRVV